MSITTWQAHVTRSLTIMLVYVLLGGCGATRLSKVVHTDPSAPGGWTEVADRDRGNVEVTRNGQRLDPRTPLPLQPGDIVTTGPNAGALIRFENGGEAILAPDTRVRLGSLEVFFGEVLADLRGKFEIWDTNLIAALGGTRFLFESQRKAQTRVAVLEGSVTCTPRAGGWEPVRLNAGEQLQARSGGDRRPRPTRLTAGEIERIERWFGGIRNAAEKGFCCSSRGGVSESYSNQCRGHFEQTRRKAEYACQQGWCCRKGHVSQTIRGDCSGSFHTRQSAAIQACEPEPTLPATGICCIDGKPRESTRKDCTARYGQFFADKNTFRRCPVQ